jgi:phosphoenolpyruvate carboxylase
MDHEWPFFRSALSNAAMVLAKSDMTIARRFSSLVTDPAVRERVFGAIAAEHAASVRAVLLIKRQTALLEDQPALARSIHRRRAYMDPLCMTQIELLRAVRAGIATDERTMRALHLTLNGVASTQNKQHTPHTHPLLTFDNNLWALVNGPAPPQAAGLRNSG